MKWKKLIFDLKMDACHKPKYVEYCIRALSSSLSFAVESDKKKLEDLIELEEHCGRFL